MIIHTTEEKVQAREQQRMAWLRHHLPQMAECRPLQNDASFRSYYRVCDTKHQYILMDSPPDVEPCAQFVKVQSLLENHVTVPTCYVTDIERGFILLSDFGDEKFLDALNDDSADVLYHSAINSLIQMQALAATAHAQLPAFDEAFMMMELERVISWYLQQLCGQSLHASTQATLMDELRVIAQTCAQMPQTFIHRDYHSRNLMCLARNQVGVIDFQDAMHGPIPYDLLSLLRDCYIAWPQARIDAWVAYYHEHAIAAGVLAPVSLETFMGWFNWVGIQRHLKCIGIFARLHLRDGKSGYLNDIPRVVSYLKAELAQVEGLETIKQFVEHARVIL